MRDRSTQIQLPVLPSAFEARCHSDRFSRRSHRVVSYLVASTWENYLMDKDVDMGWAGSLTVLLLCISVAFLLRSFYKRYTKMKDREDNGGL